MWESPYLTCLFLYIFSLQIIVTNSRTSNVWKLNAEEDQIVDGSTLSQVSQKSIIMSVNIYIISALDFLLHTYLPFILLIYTALLPCLPWINIYDWMQIIRCWSDNCIILWEHSTFEYIFRMILKNQEWVKKTLFST